MRLYLPGHLFEMKNGKTGVMAMVEPYTGTPSLRPEIKGWLDTELQSGWEFGHSIKHYASNVGIKMAKLFARLVREREDSNIRVVSTTHTRSNLFPDIEETKRFHVYVVAIYVDFESDAEAILFKLRWW